MGGKRPNSIPTSLGRVTGMPTDPDAGDQTPDEPPSLDEPRSPDEPGKARSKGPEFMLGMGLLWWSVLVSALCLLPVGLVAVAYCLRAVRAADQGDSALAQRCWRVARRWVFVAIALGLAVDLFILAVLLLLGAFGK